MKARKLLKKLNYLPRWTWYALSFFVAGPFGPVIAYVIFHALTKAANDESEESSAPFDWDVDIDNQGVHVRSRGRKRRAASVYQDEECTVMDEDDVLRQWQRTEASAARAKNTQDKQEPAADPVISEDSDVKAVIHEGYEALRRIRHANDLIPDPELSAQIDSIENSCGQILSILEQRPQLLPQLRTFLRYYLPTTLRLLDARAKLEKTANTPKAREVRTRISEAVGIIDKALIRQVEALDEYRFLDLESEMDVLRDMLRADGLIDEEKENDPFADVLKERASAPKGSSQDNISLPSH